MVGKKGSSNCRANWLYGIKSYYWFSSQESGADKLDSEVNDAWEGNKDSERSAQSKCYFEVGASGSSIMFCSSSVVEGVKCVGVGGELVYFIIAIYYLSEAKWSVMNFR